MTQDDDTEEPAKHEPESLDGKDASALLQWARSDPAIQAAIRRVLDNAPPLTPEQREVLAELLSIEPPPDTPYPPT